jgi:hypothetical protein
VRRNRTVRRGSLSSLRVRRPIDLDQALRFRDDDDAFVLVITGAGETTLRHQERLISIVERFAEDSGLRGEVSEWQAAAKNRSVSLEDLLRKPSVFPRHGRE